MGERAKQGTFSCVTKARNCCKLARYKNTNMSADHSGEIDGTDTMSMSQHAHHQIFSALRISAPRRKHTCTLIARQRMFELEIRVDFLFSNQLSKCFSACRTSCLLSANIVRHGLHPDATSLKPYHPTTSSQNKLPSVFFMSVTIL